MIFDRIKCSITNLIFKEKIIIQEVEEQNQENDKDKDKMILLSPKILSKENQIGQMYFERIDKLVNNSQTNNIAISGSYGTGKTSIIETYINWKLKKEKEKLIHKKSNRQINRVLKNKYILISIGSFLKIEDKAIKHKDQESNNKKRDNESHNNDKLGVSEYELVDKIEKSILKQLVYRNSEHEIPKSKIKRIDTKRGLFNTVQLTFLITAPIIYLLVNYIISKIEKVSRYIPDEIINIYSNNKDIIFYVLISILIIYICNIVILLFKYIYKKRHLLRIRVKDYELEYANETDLTFTKQLYEILNFFYYNNTKVIFFEDIDRFEKDVALKVIEELKELNTIINNAAGIRGRNLTFFYSFKDSVFTTSTDRTKFYDYIITIAPLSSKYNAFFQFKSGLKTLELSTLISNKLLEITSDFINDKRLINSILNDYSLMRKVIGTEESQDKIFAMCVFKNYYIKEYDELLTVNQNIIDIVLKKPSSVKQSKEYDFLIKIVKNKYIEKDYIDYITMPTIDDNLTERDSKFIFKALHGKLSFNERVDNPDTVIECLDNRYEKTEILNCDIIAFLLISHTSFSSNSKGEMLKQRNRDLKILEQISNQYKDNLNLDKLRFLKVLSENNNQTLKEFLEYLSLKNIILWNIVQEQSPTKYKNVKQDIIKFTLYQELKKIKDESLFKKDIECLGTNDKAELINDETTMEKLAELYDITQSISILKKIVLCTKLNVDRSLITTKTN